MFFSAPSRWAPRALQALALVLGVCALCAFGSAANARVIDVRWMDPNTSAENSLVEFTVYVGVDTSPGFYNHGPFVLENRTPDSQGVYSLSVDTSDISATLGIADPDGVIIRVAMDGLSASGLRTARTADKEFAPLTQPDPDPDP
ncbi:MAG: hypothetical protein JRG92_13745, partial [Deltaproteobacteria bacterium]|nr:hypothetical protein [Deltaproteobacteria bacterium]